MAAMTARWLVVLFTAAALVATPVVIGTRPAAPSDISAVELAGRVRHSADVGWSGYVETSGTLQVPDNESFATLAQMLGENTQLRVWWRTADDWRVDRIRATGEADLFRQQGYTIRWVFESQTATFSPVSKIRLPDASDLLPPTLARGLMQGARDDRPPRPDFEEARSVQRSNLDTRPGRRCSSPRQSGVDGCHYLIRRRPDGWPQWTGRRLIAGVQATQQVAVRDQLLARGRTAAREFGAEGSLACSMLWRTEREHPACHVAVAVSDPQAGDYASAE